MLNKHLLKLYIVSSAPNIAMPPSFLLLADCQIRVVLNEYEIFAAVFSLMKEAPFISRRGIAKINICFRANISREGATLVLLCATAVKPVAHIRSSYTSRTMVRRILTPPSSVMPGWAVNRPAQHHDPPADESGSTVVWRRTGELKETYW
jgi:hypothetical protein